MAGAVGKPHSTEFAVWQHAQPQRREEHKIGVQAVVNGGDWFGTGFDTLQGVCGINGLILNLLGPHDNYFLKSEQNVGTKVGFLMNRFETN